MNITIPLLATQHAMVNDWNHDRQMFVSGYRGGKTFSMLVKLLVFASENPGIKSIVMEPTFSMLSSIIIPDFEDLLEELNIPYTSRKSPFPQYFLQFAGGIHEVRLYSAENHNRLRGFECAAIFLDEFETIEKGLATEIYRKCVARLSEGNGFKFIAMYSTPDQKGFCYTHFVEEPADNKKLYQASTHENFFLPDGYIETLLRDYPKHLVDAYVNGQWVNLNQNRVYQDYDREFNNTSREVLASDTLHIGIDFNHNIMAATVFVINHDGDPLAVDEFRGDKDTQSLIQSIKKRYKSHKIYIYPDASGIAEKTSAASSDIAQLRLAFNKRNVIHHKKNPLIQTRINSVNSMILDGSGNRRFRINSKKCPLLVRALEEQAYKNGKPDKSYELDDQSDSMGYFIFTKYQIKRPNIRVFG